MWTPATRRQHNRDELRYATDLTDAEWKILTRYLPAPATTGRRRTPLREIVAAIFSILRAGCPWRLLPRSFPPWKTVYRWFARFRDDGTWRAINHYLLARDRERVGREATLRWLSIGFADGTLRQLRPGAAVIDSQSVQTTEAGGPKGYDAGKKVSGRKRHALVDTEGRPLVLHVHPASVQDRDGAVPLLKASRESFPFVERAFADSAYTAGRVAEATSIAIEIRRKPPGQVGFAVQPRRWVIERTCAWLNRNRRLAKDFEATVASATSFLYAASVMLLLRRLGRYASDSRRTLSCEIRDCETFGLGRLLCILPQ